MQRRKLLLATGGALATATAGCLGTGSESESTEQSDVDVDVEFSVDDSNLVASHISGDVLQDGQSVYLTIEGDQVAEKTLDSDVHTGSEIIRVRNVNDDFEGEKRVGLYLQRSDQAEELAVETVTISRTYRAPQTQIDFHLTASTDTVELISDGGAELTTENTGRLILNHDGGRVTWINGSSGDEYAIDQSINVGDTIVTIENIDTAGDEIHIIWESPNGSTSQSLGSFERP